MFLVITGLAKESRIAAGPGVSHVICSGSDPGRLRAHLSGLDPTGLRAVISFGIAGGLDPSLGPGSLILARRIVAAGEAELGFSIGNSFLSVRGVELIGLFPSDLQYWVVFTAGVSVTARQPGAGKALIEELSSQDAAAVIKAQGLEPLRVN